MHLAARVEQLAPSATLAVDAEARRLREAGRDVIGFGAGEPDFATPEHVQAAVVEAAADRRNHGYTAAAGLPALRAAIARRTADRWGAEVVPSQVIVTNGGKHAAYAAFQALLDPGDEVIHQVPLWPTFPEVVRLAGGVPVGVPVEGDFSWDPDRLRKAITVRTKALLVVSPSNPTGATWEEAELKGLADLAAEHDLWVITDEIYDRLVYGRSWAPSLPAAVESARSHCIVLNGVSKTYAMTGWRVGWIVAPPAAAAALAKLQGQMTSNVANVSQIAALAALEGPQDILAPMKDAFARRRDRMVAGLARVPGLEVQRPPGAFYVYPDLRGVLARTGAADTLEFAAELLSRAGVAIVPGEAFGTSGYARLSFALDDEALERGVQRIADFVEGTPVEF